MSNDEPFDAGTFEFDFPVYLVVRGTPDGPKELVVNRAEGQEPFVPVFTDQDLAERFAATLPPGGKMTLIVPTPEALRGVLSQAVADGVSYVGFDPGRRVTKIPVGMLFRAAEG